MPMKFLSLRGLAFGVVVMLSLTALGVRSMPSSQTQSEREAEMAAHEKAAADSGNVMAEYLYARISQVRTTSPGPSSIS